MSDVLSVWTIYDHPSDVPEPFGFAVREFLVKTSGRAEADSRVQFAMTLDEARALIPAGLYRLPRADGDDPVIVETWI